MTASAPGSSVTIMTSRLNPYLAFRDDARSAMEHYRDVLGGELTISTFGEYGGEPAEAVMHAQLETPLGFVLMAADTPREMPHSPGNNVAVSLSGDSEDAGALRGYFAALAEGGEVQMPLEKQIWGDEFGMCVDRFGIGWLVNITDQAR